MKTKTTKPKARITSISISRLYNTGNYTNIKYDIAAEVPAGVSAADTLKELYYVLQMLKPLHKPGCYEQFKATIAKMEGEQSEYEKEHLPEWREEFEQFNAWKAAREAAVKSLDALGGTSTKRDAKKTWDDDDPYF